MKVFGKTAKPTSLIYCLNLFLVGRNRKLSESIFKENAKYENDDKKANKCTQMQPIIQSIEFDPFGNYETPRRCVSWRNHTVSSLYSPMSQI